MVGSITHGGAPHPIGATPAKPRCATREAFPTANTAASIWNDVLNQVRLNQPQLVRGWFSELTPARVENGVLGIQASNLAQSRYLQQHCRRAFAEAAQAATGRLVTVTFEAADREDVSTTGPVSFDDTEQQLPLNPDYNFGNFVTGPCNRLAHAASLAVAQRPGQAYNPFFVYGPVGLGKTHLLQAVCHTIRDARDTHDVLYLSCETFINHFIEAVEAGALHHFRYRYRHASVLVIDDIQFLAERERSQEEFFHTFNTLHQSQRQIILSADCSPSEIPSLEERLVSRFNSGLVTLLDRPCLETRMAILRKKAKLRCVEVPDDVIRFVAGRFDGNIRDLEGALMKIDALSHTDPGPITLDLARRALGEATEHHLSIPAIMELVASRLGMKLSDLQSKKRPQSVTRPRHVCMYLARQLTPHSLEEIGGYFGGRDHSTVLHACRGIERALKTDERLTALIDDLMTELKHA
ncbi:MAG: chromosomal replication initiator protein DnaA [Phycisphaerae bacterium]